VGKRNKGERNRVREVGQRKEEKVKRTIGAYSSIFPKNSRRLVSFFDVAAVSEETTACAGSPAAASPAPAPAAAAPASALVAVVLFTMSTGASSAEGSDVSGSSFGTTVASEDDCGGSADEGGCGGRDDEGGSDMVSWHRRCWRVDRQGAGR
jgi:hypothetical protein